MNLFQFLRNEPFFQSLSTGDVQKQIMRGKIFLNGRKISIMEKSPELSCGDFIEFKGHPLNCWKYEPIEEIRFLPDEGIILKNSIDEFRFQNGDVLQIFSIQMKDGKEVRVRLSAKRMWANAFSFSDEFSDIDSARKMMEESQIALCARLLSISKDEIEFVDSLDGLDPASLFSFREGECSFDVRSAMICR